MWSAQIISKQTRTGRLYARVQFSNDANEDLNYQNEFEISTLENLQNSLNNELDRLNNLETFDSALELNVPVQAQKFWAELDAQKATVLSASQGVVL